MAACEELQEIYRKSIEQALIRKLNKLKKEQSKVLQDKAKTWGNSNINLSDVAALHFLISEKERSNGFSGEARMKKLVLPLWNERKTRKKGSQKFS